MMQKGQKEPGKKDWKGRNVYKTSGCGVEASRCARKASETHEALPMGQTQGWALRVLFSGLFSYFKKITAWVLLVSYLKSLME